ncbi:MAG TPA: hypothetical protein VKV25_10870 [Acidimicrobiales bacterium]|nr:hypothetical protein [Acidimicrobiales bacterium]
MSTSDVQDAEQRLEALAPGYAELARRVAARIARRDPGGVRTSVAFARVVERSRLDLGAPIASRLPGVRLVKGTVRALIRWYLRWIDDQINGLVRALLVAHDAVAARVETLEERAGRTGEQVRALEGRVERLERAQSACDQ